MRHRAVIVIALGGVAACAFHPAGAGGGDGAGDDVGDVDGGGVDDPTVDAGADDPTTPLQCPAGYAAIGASRTRYRVVEVNVPWEVAAADCNDDDDTLGSAGGRTHLVVVGDVHEKAALTNQFSGNTWVGLSDTLVEGSFVWVTNEPTGGFPIVGERPPWDAGDPDGGRAENCVRFKNSFDFEDKSCAEVNSYVCECDAFAPR
jgi:hypothetical protein